MIIALDDKDEMYNSLFHKIDWKEYKYICPNCKEKVIPVNKSINSRVAHFRHYVKSLCVDNEPETIEHVNMKICVSEKLRGVMEKKIGSKIADVFIEDKKIVIEVQNSPISVKTFRERNKNYEDLGYRVIWMLNPLGKVVGIRGIKKIEQLVNKMPIDIKLISIEKEIMKKYNLIYYLNPYNLRFFCVMEKQYYKELEMNLNVINNIEKENIYYIMVRYKNKLLYKRKVKEEVKQQKILRDNIVKKLESLNWKEKEYEAYSGNYTVLEIIFDKYRYSVNQKFWNIWKNHRSYLRSIGIRVFLEGNRFNKNWIIHWYL